MVTFAKTTAVTANLLAQALAIQAARVKTKVTQVGSSLKTKPPVRKTVENGPTQRP
jgi:hypothetical protein